MEETKRRRFIIRAVLEGEVEVADNPQPAVNIFEGKDILFDKYVSVSNGTVGNSSTGEFTTDMLSISDIAPSYLVVEFVGASVSQYAYRVAFYDSDQSFISCVYDDYPFMSVVVPATAVFIRLGGKYSGMTDIEVYEGGQGLNDYTMGEYWSPDDGTIVADANYARFDKIPVESPAAYYEENVFTACYYNDSTFISAEKNLQYKKYFHTVAGANFAGIYCQAAKVAQVVAATAKGELIGSKES